jgi:amino-acid N-acetyltransferase
LRRAKKPDLPAIERLLVENKLPFEDISGHLDTYFVAEADGALVGVAGLEPCGEVALLRSVAVDAKRREEGVGHALVVYAIEQGCALGCRALYLLTTTAERYFQRFGFQPIQRGDAPDSVRQTHEFTTACPQSATVMRRLALS